MYDLGVPPFPHFRRRNSRRMPFTGHKALSDCPVYQAPTDVQLILLPSMGLWWFNGDLMGYKWVYGSYNRGC